MELEYKRQHQTSKQNTILDCESDTKFIRAQVRNGIVAMLRLA